jgi:hypothetical protein
MSVITIGPAVPATVVTAPVAAKRLDRNTVVHALNADECLGFAVARFQLTAEQLAWNPAGTRGDRQDFEGPATLTYERQLGEITARYGS